MVFGGDKDLLDALSESDLNQLLERRSIGGDPRLVRAMGRAVVDVSLTDVPRRLLIREATPWLPRWLAFIDVRAMTDDQVNAMCRRLVTESAAHHRASIGR